MSRTGSCAGSTLRLQLLVVGALPSVALFLLRFAERPVASCLDRLGEASTIPAFAECLGDREVGAVRASLGLGSLMRDVERVLAFLGE